MKDQIFLILSEEGVVKMTRRPPSLKGNERAIELSIEAPDSIFEYSFIRKSMVITEDDIIEPPIEIQTVHALGEV